MEPNYAMRMIDEEDVANVDTKAPPSSLFPSTSDRACMSEDDDCTGATLAGTATDASMGFMDDITHGLWAGLGAHEFNDHDVTSDEMHLFTGSPFPNLNGEVMRAQDGESPVDLVPESPSAEDGNDIRPHQFSHQHQHQQQYQQQYQPYQQYQHEHHQHYQHQTQPASHFLSDVSAQYAAGPAWANATKSATAATASNGAGTVPAANEKVHIRRRRSSSSLSHKIQKLLQTAIMRASDPNGKLAIACGCTQPSTSPPHEVGGSDDASVDHRNENIALIQAWEKVRDSRGRYVLTTSRADCAILSSSGARSNQQKGQHASASFDQRRDSGDDAGAGTSTTAKSSHVPPGDKSQRGFAGFRHASKQYYFHIDPLEGHADLPGRAWSTGVWEYSHDAQLYDRSEYARNWVATSADVRASLAVPVIYIPEPHEKQTTNRSRRSTPSAAASMAKNAFVAAGDEQLTAGMGATGSGTGDQRTTPSSMSTSANANASVVAVLEVVHSSARANVLPLLCTIAEILEDVGLCAGGFASVSAVLRANPHFNEASKVNLDDTSSLTTPSLLRTICNPVSIVSDSNARLAEQVQLTQALSSAMGLPLVQLWRACSDARGEPSLADSRASVNQQSSFGMETHCLPFVVTDKSVASYRFASCLSTRNDLGPVRCCREASGSPQWWPSAGDERMSAFPLAHAARASGVHGVVTMGVRWRNIESMAGNAMHSAMHCHAPHADTVDYIIECVLPLKLVGAYAQSQAAIRCCEMVWQLSSRDEYHFFPLTGDGMATSVTLRSSGVDGAAPGTTRQVPLFSNNGNAGLDGSGINGVDLQAAPEGLASLMVGDTHARMARHQTTGAPAAATMIPTTVAATALDAYAKSDASGGVGGGGGGGTYATQTLAYQGLDLFPSTQGGGGAASSSPSGMEDSAFIPSFSLLPLAPTNEVMPPMLTVLGNLDADTSNVEKRRGDIARSGLEQSSSLPGSAQDMMGLPLLFPGFALHFPTDHASSAMSVGSGDLNQPTSLLGNNASVEISINSHSMDAIDELREALTNEGLMVHKGNECVVGRNVYASLTARKSLWMGQPQPQSKQKKEESTNWKYEDTRRIIAALAAFGCVRGHTHHRDGRSMQGGSLRDELSRIDAQQYANGAT